jgi:hypothetical protein
MASHLTGCLHYPASIILVSLAPNRKPIIRRGTQALLKYLITLMAQRVVTRTKAHSLATRGESRPDSLLSALLGYRSDRPPHAATETGLPHDHAPFVAAFPDSGKTPAQTNGSCCRHRDELRCVADSDLRFIRPDPVSSRCCSEAAGASCPIADD